jgi:transposase
VLTLPPGLRIYVAIDPVDMRKSFDGLAGIIQTQLQLDPLAGHLVLFTNRRRDLLKIFFFDRSGYTIIFRRLEQGTFQFPKGESRVQIDVAQLAMILEGIDLRSVVRRKRYAHPAGSLSET